MVLASNLPLPDECIDLIVAYLVEERQALHALVLASRKLFARATPILYRSPFQLIEKTRYWSRDEKDRRSTILLALLLSSRTALSYTSPSQQQQQPVPVPLQAPVPINPLRSSSPPSLLSNATLEATINNHTSGSATSAPIPISAPSPSPAVMVSASFHHRLQQQQQQQQQLFKLQKKNSLHQPPATLDYLRFYTHQYHVDLWQPLVNLRELASKTNMYILDESKNTPDLQIDVAMAMIMYCPEDIKVIGQSFLRAPLVLVPYVMILRSLVRLELSEIPYGCKMEGIIEFIRVHDAVHNTLREIKIKGAEDLNQHPHQNRAHCGLVKIVQSMRTPTVVDARCWREAILVLNHIPHEYLKTLLLGMGDMPPPNMMVAQYLESCLMLEELRMPVRDEGLFAWAKKARLATLSSSSSLARRRGAAAAASAPSRPGSVPLTGSNSRTSSSDSKSSMSSSGSSCNDGPYLISNSLTSLSSSSLLSPSATAATLATTATSVPSSSPLPFPTSWQLRHHYHPEWHEFEEKRRARVNIKSLQLCGEDRDLVPVLRDALDGFRDSLESLKAESLATIEITALPTHSFMPLTWSWTLPRLTVLELEGEVASIFDLSALKYCPMLTTLKLALPTYMYSNSEDRVTVDEMKRRVSDICLATQLLDLELHGKWPISDELLRKMAMEMRRLTRVYVVNCTGFTIAGICAFVLGSERLESLAISKWLCYRGPSRSQLQYLMALNPRLEIIEE
ncbi:hypothetical protein BCR41DRAFT_346755 [Lobosporangium transversale]|uniref:Uncharacterized protein n=1 Tax=Lobosporangium transversale TaxID=64571 RepID=A0A1Y2GYN9_9FUNG|nr:hypothetical protein BCR41DRAFT_346755 [Lobosporangium transversale]ORZ27418.1 hypothetical protein BCR41DRAFT_346755 [Lobosporangium transversale]|eukprot:XP_021885145.1 hypothetical protein BCR41DRAFT_346755 [Lobosporangium transversale]